MSHHIWESIGRLTCLTKISSSYRPNLLYFQFHEWATFVMTEVVPKKHPTGSKANSKRGVPKTFCTMTCLEHGESLPWQVLSRGQLSWHVSSSYYEHTGLGISQTLWTRSNSRKEEALQAEPEWERLTFQLLHQTKGQQSSFPPGRSSPALKGTRPWCTSCPGWRSRGNSPTSWSPESPVLASYAAGNSTGALSNKNRPKHSPQL